MKARQDVFAQQAPLALAPARKRAEAFLPFLPFGVALRSGGRKRRGLQSSAHLSKRILRLCRRQQTVAHGVVERHAVEEDLGHGLAVTRQFLMEDRCCGDRGARLGECGAAHRPGR